MQLGHHIGPVPQDMPEHKGSELFATLWRLASSWNSLQVDISDWDRERAPNPIPDGTDAADSHVASLDGIVERT